MIYVRSFSFIGKNHAHQPLSGHFTCVVEANSPEETEEKFQKLLARYKDENNVFALLKFARIYQDSLVEVRTVPEDGGMLTISEYFGERPPGNIIGVVPGDEEGLTGFHRNTGQDVSGGVKM